MLDERPIGERCRERWRSLLPALGIDRKFLTGKHGPCPACGGKDRYRFDDKDGRGKWICNQCGAGDGFALLKLVNGWDFGEAARRVDEIIGDAKVTPQRLEQSDAEKREALRKLWLESRPIAAGDVVDRYLHSRKIGFSAYPECLRIHDAGSWPMLLALVTGPKGEAGTIHRTFLAKDGSGKAPVEQARKLMPGAVLDGSAIRLSPADTRLGIAEGIETALAASLMFDLPVWSALSTAMLKKWEPPTEAQEIVIFADNDPKFGGLAAAAALAHRLACKDYGVEIKQPEIVGEDWNDELLRIYEGRA